ncbi:ankyrin repeat-containing domain protein [Aspergillus carlsbadensis]|nr:ankyrin repeat-containing domain protein [Aspergillus carlsbadensis]
MRIDYASGVNHIAQGILLSLLSYALLAQFIASEPGEPHAADPQPLNNDETKAPPPSAESTEQTVIREADAERDESDPGYASQDQSSEKGVECRDAPGNTTQDRAIQKDAQDGPQEPQDAYAINESDFAVLGSWATKPIIRGDPLLLRRALEDEFHLESAVLLSSRIMGYAISRRDAVMLEACAEWVKDKYRAILAGKDRLENLQGYTNFALERQYDDIIAVLYVYFPAHVNLTVTAYAQSAIWSDSLAGIQRVWQYLPDHATFIDHNMAGLVLNRQNDILRFMASSPLTTPARGLESLMTRAIYGKAYETIESLCLVKGVDPRKGEWLVVLDIPRVELPSPLFRAAAQRDVRMLTMLLDKDALVHPNEGMIPGLLEAALAEGPCDAADLLLARGADILEVSLDLAVRLQWKDLVKTLLQSGRRDFQSAIYGSVLQSACMRSDTETATLLLEYGHAINPKSPMALGGNSPLTGAIFSGSPDLVDFLISKGASVSRARSASGNALQTAVTRGRNDLVPVLISHSTLADLDGILPQSRREPWFLNRVLGGFGRPAFDAGSFLTPLGFAVERRDVELARMLLEAGASRGLLSSERRVRLDEMLAASE